MSKLYIKRNTGWLHNNSKVKILLNNKKVFALKDEELDHIELEPGNYDLEAKFWGYGRGKKSIQIKEGENLHFNLKEGSGQWKYIMASILVLLIIYFGLGSSNIYIVISAIIGISYFSFHMSRNKNSYLKFEEAKV